MNTVLNTQERAQGAAVSTKEVMSFKNAEFGNIRVAEIEGETWFCLKDVCDCLDLVNPSKVKESLTLKGLKIFNVKNTLTISEGIGTFTEDVQSKLGERDCRILDCTNTVANSDGNGTFQRGNPNATFIDEGNLYQVIFQSRKPNAAKFKEWVCYEVLPTIRKHGAYMTQDILNEMLTNPDTLITLLTNIKEERARRQAAEVTIETNRPKVEYADRCLAATNGMTVRQFSALLLKNGYDTGERRLFQWLRDNRYIYRKGKNNLPYQKWLKKGLFEVKKSVYPCNGKEKTTLTPMITEKGQMYLMDLMLSA